jgi:hypothetical protein
MFESDPNRKWSSSLNTIGIGSYACRARTVATISRMRSGSSTPFPWSNTKSLAAKTSSGGTVPPLKLTLTGYRNPAAEWSDARASNSVTRFGPRTSWS